jgi:two-component system LytT family response regulator
MNKELSFNDVIYLKAESNYTIFYFENGKKYISGYTLKYHQSKIELNGFCRVNRAYLLNPKYIAKISREGNLTSISMINGIKTKVSRRRTLETSIIQN